MWAGLSGAGVNVACVICLHLEGVLFLVMVLPSYHGLLIIYIPLTIGCLELNFPDSLLVDVLDGPILYL